MVEPNSLDWSYQAWREPGSGELTGSLICTIDIGGMKIKDRFYPFGDKTDFSYHWFEGRLESLGLWDWKKQRLSGRALCDWLNQNTELPKQIRISKKSKAKPQLLGFKYE